MTDLEREPSWVEYWNKTYPNIPEMYPVDMKIVVKKYKLDVDKFLKWSILQYKLFEDGKFHLRLSTPFVSSKAAKCIDDLLIDDLVIEATDIPEFVKQFKRWEKASRKKENQ